MIAWVSGAGSEGRDWSDLYDRIDRLGKGQWRYLTDRQVVKEFWRRSRSRKLAFTIAAESPGEVEDFLGELEQIKKDETDPSQPTGDRPQR
jgi:hypothetical protein